MMTREAREAISEAIRELKQEGLAVHKVMARLMTVDTSKNEKGN